MGTATDSGSGVQKNVSANSLGSAVKADGGAKADTAAVHDTTSAEDIDIAIDSAVDSAGETTPSQSRSQSTSRAVAGLVSMLWRGHASQPPTSATKVGESLSISASADMRRQDSQPDLALQTASADTHPEHLFSLAKNTPVVPTAQMVAPVIDTGSTEAHRQPFQGSQDFRDSGGGSPARGPAPVGLGINATGDAGVTVETKEKRKKKKSKKNNNTKEIALHNAIDGLAMPVKAVGFNQVTKLPVMTASPPPGNFTPPQGLFTFGTPYLNAKNGSNTLSRAASHTPSNSQDSIPDSASSTSSQTIGRSSTGDTIASDSPTRSTRIREAISKGSPHLIQGPRASRLLHKGKRMTSFARESQSASSPEEAESEINKFDDLIGKALEKSAPPMLYVYLGAGKRGAEPGWENENAVQIEEKAQQAVDRRCGGKGNAENVKPAPPSPRKGG